VTPGDGDGLLLQSLVNGTTQTGKIYFVDLPIGKKFNFLVKDSTDSLAFSATLVVNSSPDDPTRQNST
jgi:hypothetical protein